MTEPTHWAPYCGVAPLPSEAWDRWNLDPILIAVLMAALLFVLGSRSNGWNRKIAGVVAFTLSVLLLISPLCVISSALFSVRVAHHVVLAALVAPLWVAAITPGKVRVPGSLSLWVVLHAVLFWLWHLPSTYAWALSSDFGFWMMELTIFLSAFVMWGLLRRASAPAAVGALLGTMMQMGVLGALLTFAQRPLYAPHWLTTRPWGFSPLEDQQLSGLIMWVPGGGLYLAVALMLMWRWMGDGKRVPT